MVTEYIKMVAYKDRVPQSGVLEGIPVLRSDAMQGESISLSGVTASEIQHNLTLSTS